MLAITIPFTLDAIQTTLRPLATPPVSAVAEVIYGSAGAHALRPWTAEQYRTALRALAALHAHWWGNPPLPCEHPWLARPAAYDSWQVKDSREALLRIAAAPWAGRFFTAPQIDAWLRTLDNPTPLLEIANLLPPTLIHGDYWPGNISLRPGDPAVAHWQHAGTGPASYDVATFHAASRWRFGRLPLTLVDIRNCYLDSLESLLGHRPDRALFDASLDASRALRFAMLWPTAILENHALLLANASYLRATVVEPASASLRRC